MDKRNFIEQAPAFYCVAVAFSMMEGKRDVYTLSQIRPQIPALNSAIVHDALIEAGLRLLVSAGVVVVVKEAFGPPLYRRLPELTPDWAYTVAGNQIPVFRTFEQVRNWAWLAAALGDVNQHYSSLEITPADFDETIPSLWEPLPLDRGDENLIAATAAVDEAISKIEADNGYAANVSGERDYVIQSLRTFSKTLKESAQITAMQIQTFALDPLTAVAERFKGAALALVAEAAKESIRTWLKGKFAALVAWLLF